MAKYSSYLLPWKCVPSSFKDSQGTKHQLLTEITYPQMRLLCGSVSSRPILSFSLCASRDHLPIKSLTTKPLSQGQPLKVGKSACM